MNTNAKIGLTLAGGYLLGRTKKAKTALGLGVLLAGRRLYPGLRELTGTVPGLSEQTRHDLREGARTIATAAITGRVDSLADRLRERTAAFDADTRALRRADEKADEVDGPGEEEAEKRPARSRPVRRKAASRGGGDG